MVFEHVSTTSPTSPASLHFSLEIYVRVISISRRHDKYLTEIPRTFEVVLCCQGKGFAGERKGWLVSLVFGDLHRYNCHSVCVCYQLSSILCLIKLHLFIIRDSLFIQFCFVLFFFVLCYQWRYERVAPSPSAMDLSVHIFNITSFLAASSLSFSHQTTRIT